MPLLILILGTIGLLNLDSLWRGNRVGDIINAILAIVALLIVVALVLAVMGSGGA